MKVAGLGILLLVNISHTKISTIMKQVEIDLDFQKQGEQQPIWLTNMLTRVIKKIVHI